jgi:hypothetical protein
MCHFHVTLFRLCNIYILNQKKEKYLFIVHANPVNISILNKITAPNIK